MSQIAPLWLYYVNEFGNGTAIFENLVRGEFHFEGLRPRSDRRVEDCLLPSLERAVVADKDGELTRRLNRLVGPAEPGHPERALFLCNSLLNWTLMGANLLKRASTPAPRRSSPSSTGISSAPFASSKGRRPTG